MRHIVWHVTTRVPHDLGDPLLSTAILWWNAHVLPFTDHWWNGFAFHPAPGFMAFSDPRLGESLLATPLQWLGCSPVTAYNITFLATFPLSAIAAHWLGFVLTERHDAGAVAGLAFGFCPYRVAHVPHLELLAAYGMPLALAALHRYRQTRAARWAILFGAALVLLGLCCSYYLLFFSVLVALWLVWFTRRGDAGWLAALLLAGVGAAVALMPLARGYARVHEYYGFQRPFEEILELSADATSYLTAHSAVWLWGWTSRWAKSEGELFPGATICVLTAVGAVLAWRQPTKRDWLDRWSAWLLPAALACATIAYVGWMFGPWRFEIAGISLSSSAPFKPLTVAVVALAIWLAASSRFRAAYARQSTLVFYLVAAGVLFLCSLGPQPTFAGHRFLYEPPYAWLMRLSIFSSVRAPARFGLLTVLALAIAAALAFDRLRLAPQTRRVLAAAVMVGIVADGWIGDLSVPQVPPAWDGSRALGFSSVLELPAGDFTDFSAMYRATSHRLPVLNGQSGFEPTHYFTLRTALQEHDRSVFDGLPPGRILVAVDKANDHSQDWDRFLASGTHVTRLAPDDRWMYYAVEPPQAEGSCAGRDVPIAAIHDGRGPADVAALTDGDPRTWWTSAHPQQAGDSLVLELSQAARPCAVILEVGEYRVGYPRKLIVETSSDGAAWSAVASLRTAGLTLRAALEDPKRVAMSIPLAPSDAKFVRLRLGESCADVPWFVTDVSVRSRS